MVYSQICYNNRAQEQLTPLWATHQDQLSLQLFFVLVPVLGAPAALAGLHHLPLEQSADTGPLLQENLHQSDLLSRDQQPRPSQQEQRYRQPEAAAAASWGHGPKQHRAKTPLETVLNAQT